MAPLTLDLRSSNHFRVASPSSAVLRNALVTLSTLPLSSSCVRRYSCRYSSKRSGVSHCDEAVRSAHRRSPVRQQPVERKVGRRQVHLPAAGGKQAATAVQVEGRSQSEQLRGHERHDDAELLPGLPARCRLIVDGESVRVTRKQALVELPIAVPRSSSRATVSSRSASSSNWQANCDSNSLVINGVDAESHVPVILK